MQNPFNYIEIDMTTEKIKKWNKIDKYNIEDVEKISNQVCANQKTSLLMQSIMHMMIDTYDIDWLTSDTIILLAGQKECYANEKSKQTNLDELFELLRQNDNNHIAVIKYDEFNKLPLDERLEAIKQLEVDLVNFVTNEKSVDCDRLAESVEVIEREVFKIVNYLSMNNADETGMVVEIENSRVLDELTEKLGGLAEILSAMSNYFGGKADSISQH